MNGKPLDGIVE